MSIVFLVFVDMKIFREFFQAHFLGNLSGFSTRAELEKRIWFLLEPVNYGPSTKKVYIEKCQREKFPS